MQKLILTVLVGAFVSSCGVNPERLETLRQRNAAMAEQAESEEVAEVSYKESDPRGVREAVVAYNALKKAFEAGDFEGFIKHRYAAILLVDVQASPEVQDHKKTKKIQDGIRQMDVQFAALGNQRAQSLMSDSERVAAVNADALYASQDALDACNRAAATSDSQTWIALYEKYEASFDRATQMDPNIKKYVGKPPSGSGLIDVPIEVAYCEVRLAAKRVDAEDQPPAAKDLTKTYEGCGVYSVMIEAAQTGANRFGEYKVVSTSRDASNGFAKPIACEKIPTTSDAPVPVRRMVRDSLNWLTEGDVVSMAGPFEYDQRSANLLYKRGEVRVFQKAAQLKTSRCGADNPSVTCEAEASEGAEAYNHARHYLGRADIHRKSGRIERCKSMADLAYKAMNSAEIDADKEYLVADGEQMTSTELTSKIEAMKSEANDILASDWCTKP